jgi:hypothetical protein
MKARPGVALSYRWVFTHKLRPSLMNSMLPYSAVW